MRKILKNPMFRTLISTLLFGVIYLLISFICEGYVEIAIILRSMAIYFIVMSLLYVIVPKLRRTIGHDKEEDS